MAKLATYTLDVGDEYLVRKQVPDFRLESQMGTISLQSLLDGKWGLLVSFRMSFDPVATTEIAMLCKLFEEFDARNVAIITVGGDQVSNYRRWIKEIEELQAVKVTIPLISNPDLSLLEKYGCARPTPPHGNLQILSTGIFLIDIDKRIRVAMRYSPSVGRNFYEIIRAFDALQLVTYHKVSCPSNWGSGQDVFVHNDIDSEEATKILPKGFVAIKPWFRLTPCPDASL
eukprot:gene2612-5105_t